MCILRAGIVNKCKYCKASYRKHCSKRKKGKKMKVYGASSKRSKELKR